MKAVIFDLDGVLSDCSRRVKYINHDKKRDFETFYKLQSKDKPFKKTIDLLNVLAQSYIIIILTARPTRFMTETIAWLNKHNVSFDKLYMRERDDIPDFIMKRNTYYEVIKNHYEVVAVFEDRDRVVDMWRKQGLTCWQNARWKD